MGSIKVGHYAKTIIAAAVAAASVVSVAVGDDILTPTELVNVALAVLGAFGVYVIPNADKA